MRALIVSFLLVLPACENSSPASPPLAATGEEECVSERVRVRLDRNRIFWNDEAVDEPELAKRSAAHWCGERPPVIMMEQVITDPRDQAAIARSVRIGKLIETKQATLADTLKQLAEGSY